MRNDTASGTLPIVVGRSSLPTAPSLVHHTLMRSVIFPCADELHTLIECSELYVATLDSEPDVILGFLLCDSQAGAVHYIYVKKDFRNFGIARKLVEHAFGKSQPKFHTLQVQPRNPDLFKRFKPRYQPLFLLRYACKK